MIYCYLLGFAVTVWALWSEKDRTTGAVLWYASVWPVLWFLTFWFAGIDWLDKKRGVERREYFGPR